MALLVSNTVEARRTLVETRTPEPTRALARQHGVFEKILPDIDLEVVHYCEYEWFNMVDAPDVY